MPRSDSRERAAAAGLLQPSITLDKTADPTSLPEPGGSVNYTVEGENVTSAAATLTSLTDSVFGDITDGGNVLIDSEAFGPQTEDLSLGRIPDGPGEWVVLSQQLASSYGLPRQIDRHLTHEGQQVVLPHTLYQS